MSHRGSKCRSMLTSALIGELGIPFDMKKTSLLGLARGKHSRTDYEQPAKVRYSLSSDFN